MTWVAKIQFYYDLVSPFSYLGFCVLQRLSKQWQVSVEYVPISLAGLMNLSQNTPPGAIRLKAAYISKDNFIEWVLIDIERSAALYGVEMR